MVRHFHGGRGCSFPLPSIDPCGPVPSSAGSALDFSPFLLQSIPEAVSIRLRAAGFQCDADVAGLTASELSAALTGFIDVEEAAWYIDVAQGAVRSSKRRALEPARQHDVQPQSDVVKRLKPAVMQTPSCTFQWSQQQRFPGVLAPSGDHSQMLSSCWFIYQRLGRQGLQWSSLLESDEVCAKESFLKRMQLFEKKSLASRLSCLRRWAAFLQAEHFASAAILLPPPNAVYAFLRHVDKGGPTAAASVFQKLLWWNRHVGIPFPLDDPLLSIWSTPAESHLTKQRVPLPFAGVKALCELAQGAYTNLAVFASMALLPLVACMRFAHLQRTKDLRLDQGMIRGLCIKGKTRKKGARAAFEWAAPMHVGVWSNVLGFAVRVIFDLQKHEEELTFCIPDVEFGPSGRLDAQTKWKRSPMPLQKFVVILRSVLIGAGLQTSDVQLLASYSLRRFLPSVAEVLRTPPEIARHLGNWAESVSQMHHGHEPMHMSQVYAHDRVLTAAHSKSLLLQVVCRAISDSPDTASMHTIRNSGWTWGRVLQTFSSQPSLPEPTAPSDAEVVSSHSGTTSSSSSSESEDASPELHWFRLARGVAHLVQTPNKVSPIPWCRHTPFQRDSLEWGSGIVPDRNLCARCLVRAPAHIARAARALHGLGLDHADDD